MSPMNENGFAEWRSLMSQKTQTIEDTARRIESKVSKLSITVAEILKEQETFIKREDYNKEIPVIMERQKASAKLYATLISIGGVIAAIGITLLIDYLRGR